VAHSWKPPTWASAPSALWRCPPVALYGLRALQDGACARFASSSQTPTATNRGAAQSQDVINDTEPERKRPSIVPAAFAHRAREKSFGIKQIANRCSPTRLRSGIQTSLSFSDEKDLIGASQVREQGVGGSSRSSSGTSLIRSDIAGCSSAGAGCRTAVPGRADPPIRSQSIFVFAGATSSTWKLRPHPTDTRIRGFSAEEGAGFRQPIARVPQRARPNRPALR